MGKDNNSILFIVLFSINFFQILYNTKIHWYLFFTLTNCELLSFIVSCKRLRSYVLTDDCRVYSFAFSKNQTYGDATTRVQ